MYSSTACNGLWAGYKDNIHGACLPAVSHQPDWEYDLKEDLSGDDKVIGRDGLAKEELCLFDPRVVSYTQLQIPLHSLISICGRILKKYVA